MKMSETQKSLPSNLIFATLKMNHVLRYLLYRLKAGNAHGLHSPFVYDLYNKVICDEKTYYAYDRVESLRAQMLLSDKSIAVTDFGTGKQHYPQQRKISFIAKKFATSKRYGQLLFRLVNHFQPMYVLEAGTSLGLATAYLASTNSQAVVSTLEGCVETAQVAQANFDKLRLKNITITVGEFDKTLPVVIDRLPRIDFAFLDGNHQREATLRYFEYCMRKVITSSVIVLDDIHWSSGMEEAWNILKKDERVTASVDLFQFGLLFFHQSQAKQHFVLRF